jgi:hypothetical protein
MIRATNPVSDIAGRNPEKQAFDRRSKSISNKATL